MNVYDAQKAMAESLDKKFRSHPDVVDTSYTFSTGSWWWSIWHRGPAPKKVLEDFKIFERAAIQKFGFSMEVQYLPASSLPKNASPSADVTPGYSRVPMVDPDTGEEEPEYELNEDGEPIAPANGRSYSRGKRNMAGNAAMKNLSVNDKITITIEHWLPHQEAPLKAAIQEFIKNFLYEYDDQMTKDGQQFFRNAEKSVMLFDDPKKRQMMYWSFSASTPFFEEDDFYADNMEMAECLVRDLNKYLDEGEFFAPIYFLRPDETDYRMYFQQGSQKNLMDAINVYSKVLCHMNG